MKPTTPLKLSSVAFAVLWGGWMMWSVGPHDLAGIILFAIGGAVVGTGWYFAMRFVFRCMHLLPSNGSAGR